MNPFFKILCGVWCLSLLFLACEKEATEPAFLQLDSENLTQLEQPFLHTAGNRTVALNTNLDVVKVSSTADWCKASIVDNNGRFLRLEVYPNEGFIDRSAEISLYGVGVESITILVTQWSSEPSLIVAEADGLEIIDGELDFTLHITSNIDFTLDLPEWISDGGDNSSYIGSKLYTFIASPIAPGTREGEIKVISDEHPELSLTIPVTQIQNVLYPALGDFTPVAAEKGSTVVLNGSNFGTNKELVKVFFNAVEAEVLAVEDNVIHVVVPRAPGNPVTIKVQILDDEMTYPTTFDYLPSWGLYTVTGDGTAAFRGGTLAEGRLKARYISLDKNGNIFASHRDEGNNRYVVRINEAENIVEPVGSLGNAWLPNGTTVGKNNIVYLANDGKNARSYFELNPVNNWVPVERTITYASEAPPASSAYLYRLIYNHQDDHLYGIVGHADGTVIRINPATQQGEVIHRFGSHPYWYGATIDPNGTDFYVSVNSATVNYGIYHMDLSNPTGGFSRLNSAGVNAAATPAELKDGALVSAGFGQSWDYEFGPDGYLYVSDFTNHVIRRVNLSTQQVETIIGRPGVAGNTDGNVDQALLNGPRGLAWTDDGKTMYIFDYTGNRLRKWTFD